VAQVAAYTMWRFFCRSCGRLAEGWTARVPDGMAPEKCGPVICGHCDCSGFRAERIGAP
jgi:hypothetical protein